MLQPGDDAPSGIELQDQDGVLVKLADLKGKKVIVYFYPRVFALHTLSPEEEGIPEQMR